MMSSEKGVWEQRGSRLDMVSALDRKLLDLDIMGKNRIWARIPKNGFAAIFVGKFDFVAGNPPWVNWQSLAAECRLATQPLWEKYRLHARAEKAQFELGKQKRAFSMLFTYACEDNYLN